MKVLVACEESQTVCKAFRERGHEAYSCDIIDCSGGHPEWHINGDAIEAMYSQKWDLIIAHPPCTYLSKASACRLYISSGCIDPERMRKAVETRLFFQKFLEAPCERVAIENPTPLKVVALPAPTQIIQPYEYGHPYSKRTCLWLKGLPLLKKTNVIGTYEPYIPSNTSKFSKGAGGSTGAAKRGKDAAERSKTFPGIAAAMAEQWGCL